MLCFELCVCKHVSEMLHHIFWCKGCLQLFPVWYSDNLILNVKKKAKKQLSDVSFSWKKKHLCVVNVMSHISFFFTFNVERKINLLLFLLQLRRPKGASFELHFLFFIFSCLIILFIILLFPSFFAFSSIISSSSIFLYSSSVFLYFSFSSFSCASSTSLIFSCLRPCSLKQSLDKSCLRMEPKFEHQSEDHTALIWNPIQYFSSKPLTVLELGIYMGCGRERGMLTRISGLIGCLKDMHMRFVWIDVILRVTPNGWQCPELVMYSWQGEKAKLKTLNDFWYLLSCAPHRPEYDKCYIMCP